MKKLLLFTISLLTAQIIFANNFAFAAGKDGEHCEQNSDCQQGLACVTQQVTKSTGKPIKFCRPLLDVLTARPVTSKNDSAKNINNLPSITLESGVSVAIKTMLRSAMLLTIIAIVVAAIYYIISRGKDEDMTKAKDIIFYLIIGMAIMAAAYGIVAGVTQFNVFK